MDLRQLRTFATVAELGSLSKASDRLHIAQSALSRQIKLLEADLCVALFRRDGRGMVLTEAGRLLLERGGALVQQLEQVRDDVMALNGKPSGNVVLGIVPTVSCVLAGSLASRARRELPTVSLRIVESYGGHLVDWLLRGELDLAIVYASTAGPQLMTENLVRDDLVVVGAPGCGLTARRTVDLNWLVRQILVLPSQSHGLRAVLEDAAARQQVKLRINLEADSFRVLTDMVERGLAISVLPPSSVSTELMDGRLEAASTNPKIVRDIVLALPRTLGSSLATQAIASLIKDEVEHTVAAGRWNLALRGVGADHHPEDPPIA